MRTKTERRNHSISILKTRLRFAPNYRKSIQSCVFVLSSFSFRNISIVKRKMEIVCQIESVNEG